MKLMIESIENSVKWFFVALVVIFSCLIYTIVNLNNEVVELKQENIQLQKELNERNNYLELVRALRK